MAKETGINVVLQISDDDSPTNFVTLPGQESTDATWNGNPIPTTDKGDGGWASALAGIMDIAISASGKVRWPDTNGIERLRTVWQARGLIEAKIVYNAAGANHSGFFAIDNVTITGAVDGATEYSVSLSSADQLAYAAS